MNDSENQKSEASKTPGQIWVSVTLDERQVIAGAAEMLESVKREGVTLAATYSAMFPATHGADPHLALVDALATLVLMARAELADGADALEAAPQWTVTREQDGGGLIRGPDGAEQRVDTYEVAVCRTWFEHGRALSMVTL